MAMNITRLKQRLPLFSFEQLDQRLTQLWTYRALCGGLFARIDGQWFGVVIALVLHDGTRVLRLGNSSFHETFNGIEKLEEHA